MPPRKLSRTSSQQEIPSSELKAIAEGTQSPQSKLQEAAAAAESALEAQEAASSLRAAAEAIKDPKKREQYLRDAYNKEIEAHGNSKKARMLSSGAFQGGVSGAGIGAAVSAGLGTVVGTLVGTVTAIPVTAVGGLVGAGAGLAHGPWIKLGKIGEGKEDVKNEEINPDEDDVVPNPAVLREAAGRMGEMQNEKNDGGRKNEEGNGEKKEKRKPRKLEVRNKQTA